MKSIFLDTNIFLHYKLFDQIDWCGILSCDESLILIPPVTIRELNKQKELHPHKHIRERASKVLKILRTLFAESNSHTLSNANKIFLEDREPEIDYSKYRLQADIQDDQLVASVIFHRINNIGSDIILITSDDGLLLKSKARRYEINTMSLPDDHKLPMEHDSQQKQIRELEEEVLRLKSAAPDLSLTYEDGNDYYTYAIQKQDICKDDFIDQQLADLKQRRPHLEKPKPPRIDSAKNLPSYAASIAEMMQAMQNGGLIEDIDVYNKKLDDFYRSHLKNPFVEG
jgi:predicted ribonuclease YlaK